MLYSPWKRLKDPLAGTLAVHYQSLCSSQQQQAAVPVQNYAVHATWASYLHYALKQLRHEELPHETLLLHISCIKQQFSRATCQQSSCWSMIVLWPNSCLTRVDAHLVAPACVLDVSNASGTVRSSTALPSGEGK